MFGDVAFSQAPFAALGGNTFAVSISESVTAADVISAISQLFPAILETSAGQDTVSSLNNILNAFQGELATAIAAPSNAGSILLATQTETAQGTATQTRTVDRIAFQAESAVASSIVSATSVVIGIVAEIAAAIDAPSNAVVFATTVAESATGSDQSTRTVAYAGTVAEVAQAAESLTPERQANVYPTGVQLYINIGGTLIWVEIDDTQNPNWQNIGTTQAGGWVLIPTDQPPGWNEIPS